MCPPIVSTGLGLHVRGIDVGIHVIEADQLPIEAKLK
jgi:hypothetical protein